MASLTQARVTQRTAARAEALPSSWQRKLTPVCVSVKLKLALV